jgi:hypothetical protein
MYPTLRGFMQTKLNTLHIFLPDKVPIISQHESHQLQELTTPTLQALDSIQSHLPKPMHSIKNHSLLHMHQTLRKSQSEVRWHTIVIISITIILLLRLLYIYYNHTSTNCNMPPPKHKTLHVLPPLKYSSKTTKSRTTTERQNRM